MKKLVSWAVAAGLAVATPALATSALAQAKPDKVGVGIFTFTSGPAAAYGMPGRNAAELIIEKINKDGGIGGVPVTPIYVDEAQGTDRVVAEFRRLSADQSNQVMIAALSSGNCLALAPVAEQLGTPMLSWNCDTHQLLLKDRYEYVYRPNTSTIPEFVALANYLLAVKPNVKTVGIINPDYAFGHDAAAIFKAALKAQKPDIEVVAELFPRLGSSSYQTEISRLASAKPDVIFSNLWGSDLENFVRQAMPRGLFQNSQAVLAVSETILQRVKLPDGVIVSALGDGWWLSPTAQKIQANLDFVEEYRKRFNEYPVFPSFKMANTILVMKAAYEKAIKDKGGAWPTRKEVAAALKGLEVQTLTGPAKLREADNDGLVDQIVGVTVTDAKYPFPILGNMTRYPADKVTPPAGQDPFEWIKTLNDDYRNSLPKPGSYK
ncbi:MAG TPA: ABC transporter substrate-binding protein [Xanthobacteraceae bacterium]|nr:ABC transporter substrate-binding protein [Xanthobacteraceae bacterium]